MYPITGRRNLKPDNWYYIGNFCISCIRHLHYPVRCHGQYLLRLPLQCLLQHPVLHRKPFRKHFHSRNLPYHFRCAGYSVGCWSSCHSCCSYISLLRSVHYNCYYHSHYCCSRIRSVIAIYNSWIGPFDEKLYYILCSSA